MKSTLKTKGTIVLLLFSLLVSSSAAFTFKVHETRLDRYDADIFRWAMALNIDPVLYKAHCMQESGMRDGIMRDEQGYLSGKYAAAVTATAKLLQKYANKNYGIAQSILTYRIQLSQSYALPQLMGQKAYELGWRGYSFTDPDGGLANRDTALYYGAKLIHDNLKRYGYDFDKAISAYNAGSYTTRNQKVYNDRVWEHYEMFRHDFEKYGYYTSRHSPRYASTSSSLDILEEDLNSYTSAK